MGVINNVYVYGVDCVVQVKLLLSITFTTTTSTSDAFVNRLPLFYK